MAITAADIENISFTISKKGYDVDEVDDFLEKVASEIDDLNKTIADLQSKNAEATKAVEDAKASAQPANEEIPEEHEFDSLTDDPELVIREKEKIITELRSKLDAKQADDSAISQALIVAQKSADEIIANAKTKADITVQDAHDEADRIVKRAEEQKESILQQITKLEEDRESSRNGYADILRNFINDANTKLSNLGFDEDISAIPYDNSSAAPAALESDIFAGVDLGNTTAMEPATSVVDKDMSGFGDVADDALDID